MADYDTDAISLESGFWGCLCDFGLIVSRRHEHTHIIDYSHRMGIYMRVENRRRNQVQGLNVTAADIDTQVLGQGSKSPAFRYMY